MDKYFDTLKLLKSLDSTKITRYIKNGDFIINKYNKNVILHFEGEPCTKTEIILSGNVVVERIDESGGLMSVAEFVSGDLIGGNLVFSKNPYYPMTVTTRDNCVILEIKKHELFNLFIENPEFLRTFLEYISDHASMLGDKIKHYVNRTIRESILSYLQHESKAQDAKKITLNITKTALAEKMGVQRTSLSRELNKMKKDGLIDFDMQSITILKDF